MRRIAAMLSLLTALFALWWGGSWLYLVFSMEANPGVITPPFGLYAGLMLAGAIAASRAAVLIVKHRPGREPVLLLCFAALACGGFTLPSAMVLWTTGLLPLVAAGLAHAVRPPPDPEPVETDDPVVGADEADAPQESRP